MTGVGRGDPNGGTAGSPLASNAPSSGRFRCIRKPRSLKNEMRVYSSRFGARRTFSSTIGESLASDLQHQFDCVSRNVVKHHLLVCGQNRLPHPSVFASHRLDVAGRFDVQLVFVIAQSDAPRQRHDLIPSVRRIAGVHVVDDDDAAFAVRCCRWCVDARRCGCAEVKESSARYDEFVALHVVIAEQILSAAHVAEERQYPAVADRPEVGTSTVVAD